MSSAIKQHKPNALAGATLLLRGFTRLGQRDIRLLVIAPLLINLVVFSVALWVAGHYFELFLQWILPTWLDFLRWILWPVFGALFVLLVFFTFTLVANVLGAPFHALLADRLLGQAGVLDRARRDSIVRSTWRSMSAELRRVLGFLLRALPVFVLFVIPGINMIAPPLWLGVTAWYITRNYFSYPLDTLGLTFAEQESRLKELGLLRLLFGLTVQVGLSVPLLNVLVPPAAVAAASLAVVERERRSA
ncbi:sulfate transporter CysZ [Methylolobus aquaticus]